MVLVMPPHEWEVRGVVRYFLAKPEMPCSAAVGLYPLAGPYLSHAPFAAAAPAVAGIHHPGRSLVLGAGTWRTGTFTPTADGTQTLAYRWEIAMDADGNPWGEIEGATAATYQVDAGLVGWWIRAVVRCTDSRGTPAAAVWREAATPWVQIVNQSPSFLNTEEAHPGQVLGVYPLAGSNDAAGYRLVRLACDQLGCSIPLEAEDPDAIDPLTITAVSAPRRGTVASNAGAWTYTPDQSGPGNDDVLFRVSDGLGGAAYVLVSLSISETPT